MILRIEDDGVTVVNVTSKSHLILMASALVNILENIPEVNMMVSGVLAGKLTLDDLGVTSQVKRISAGEDEDKAIRLLQGQAPAKVDDVPDFVKRSLDKLKDEK